MKEFTIRDFNETYPNDDVCLDEIFTARYGEGKIECSSCGKQSNFYRIKDRKVYGCQYCGHQISPLAGTIFHKSETSLKNWFYVIFMFAVSKNGVSGKEVQRALGCTYKTAWRMAKQVQLLFAQSQDILSGIVESDETYVGGLGTGKRGRGAENKTPVLGIVERQGIVKATVIRDTKKRTVSPILRESIQVGTVVITDEYRSYNNVSKMGYTHQTVRHSSKEFVRGNIHTNTIEGFWSQLKRSIDGTHHAVSPKHLQQYVNEFAWKYNRRLASSPMFELMLREVVKRVG